MRPGKVVPPLATEVAIRRDPFLPGRALASNITSEIDVRRDPE